MVVLHVLPDVNMGDPRDQSLEALEALESKDVDMISRGTPIIFDQRLIHNQ